MNWQVHLGLEYLSVGAVREMVRSHFSADDANELTIICPDSVYSAFVGLVDEIGNLKIPVWCRTGEIVSEPARSMARGERPRDDIVLPQPDVDIARDESRELEQSRFASGQPRSGSSGKAGGLFFEPQLRGRSCPC